MTDLSTVKLNQTVSITGYSNTELELKLIEFGLTINSKVTVSNKAPFGGPIIILTESGKLALRMEEAKQVLIK